MEPGAASVVALVVTGRAVAGVLANASAFALQLALAVGVDMMLFLLLMLMVPAVGKRIPSRTHTATRNGKLVEKEDKYAETYLRIC